jgi:predicted TPR repeat methyltransferase
MVEALVALAGSSHPAWDVLDLGCGTGLVGAEIAPHSQRLVGIDLSANMIDRARDRGVYGELHCADLSAGLAAEEARKARYHVITAADVFVYVGKLDSLLAAIRRCLHPRGLLAFSAEAADGASEIPLQGYRLGLMGRYGHRVDYLERLAAQNRFEIELMREASIRFEHGHPVPGWLCVFRAAELARRG